MSGYRAFAAAVLVVAGLVTAMIATEAATWQGSDSGCIAQANCDCEAFRNDGFAVQPVNTASNLGFIAVGLAVLFGARRRRPGEALTVVFGTVTMGLGVGSALFHATLTSWGGWADLVAMYLFICLYIAINIGDRLGWSSGRTLALFAIAAGLLAAVQVPLDQGSGRYVSGVLIGVALLAELSLAGFSRDRRWLYGAIVVFAVSFAAWNLSRTGAPWCRPESSLQGHAVWHLGSAAAVAMLYRYLQPALVRASVHGRL